MMASYKRLSAIALIAAMWALPAAQASAPQPPSVKPDNPYASRVVSTTDAAILHGALDAADRGDWRRVDQFQAAAGDDTVKNLILWRKATRHGDDLSFEELATALERLEGWPRTSLIRGFAERAIGDSRLSYAERAAWLSDGGPVSGDGEIALAIAEIQTGQRAAGDARMTEAFRGRTLTTKTVDLILEDYSSRITQDDLRARVDFLLWTGQRSSAQRLSRRLTSDYGALANARIALAARRRGVDRAIQAVPSHLQDHPGLLYDRARWRRQRGRTDAATPLLFDIDTNAVPDAGRSRLWRERHLAVRRAIKGKDYRSAYTLAAPHGLNSGADFATAEFLAGWLSLRKEGDAARAAQHFSTLGERVSTPISKSRSDYWSGRALEALGQSDEAQAAYADAALFPYTYYGQLAAERSGDRTIAFDAAAAPTEADRAAFEAKPLVKALRLLAEAGETGLFRQFAYHLDDTLEQPADFLLLKALGEEYRYDDVGVRGAKSGLARGIVAPEAAYPLVEFPLLREPRVERSLMLALSRQESEMNPRAISHANARGLMQFLPTTARTEARRRGLPYRTSWLTDDPGYNMTLGGAHLDTLLEQFNGSYIMTAAAYNAGARRPRAWIGDYGDPRRGEVDPIDWVEMIPFSETRNYVQRVLENTQVYRHRLSGEAEEIRLSQDLDRGRMVR
ncbi:MAG: lytic transglycosylase domain-containing protein [Pseudomonadota bacterium]